MDWQRESRKVIYRPDQQNQGKRLQILNWQKNFFNGIVNLLSKKELKKLNNSTLQSSQNETRRLDMVTNNVLEAKIAGLEKELTESRDAIRRMSTESNNLLAMISRLSEDVSKLKVDTANFKISLERQVKTQAAHRYE
jgi:septal ring factor EnvC (AmiA/AmiB activator)